MRTSKLGETPTYLIKIQSDIEKENQVLNQLAYVQPAEKIDILTDREKDEILIQLKEKHS